MASSTQDQKGTSPSEPLPQEIAEVNQTQTEEKKKDSSPAPTLDLKTDHDANPETTNIFSEGGKNYRTLNRWDTILILFTNQIGIGVLSLPSIMAELGLVPGIIAVILIGLLTWYAAFVLLQFYKRHPQVVNMVEMCKVVGGRNFEILAGVLNVIQFVCFSASPAVTISVALNFLSDHALCTAVFIFIASVVSWLFTLPRTMKFVSQCGIPNAISVIVAVGIALISLAVAGPRRAPPGWEREIKVIAYPTFRKGFNACLRISYSYAANCTFVSYMAEMIDPVRDFNFCLTVLEVGSIVTYAGVGIVLYCLSAQYTVSPVLGSAYIIPAKVAYGIVLFAILTNAMSNGHTGCKYIYVETMRKMGAIHRITDNSFKSWGTWVGIVTIFWIVVFILSNAIPVFDSILSITSAATVAWFTYGFSGIFWLNLNKGRWFSTWKKTALTLLNFFLIGFSFFINGVGLWSSISELDDMFKDPNSTIDGVFSCGNNVAF